MTDEEWGPWIEHDGKGCPCVGMHVQAKMDRTGVFAHGIVSGLLWEGVPTGINCWDWSDTAYPHFIRYRIRKPRGMKVLEELLQNLPEDVDA